MVRRGNFHSTNNIHIVHNHLDYLVESNWAGMYGNCYSTSSNHFARTDSGCYTKNTIAIAGQEQL